MKVNTNRTYLARNGTVIDICSKDRSGEFPFLGQDRHKKSPYYYNENGRFSENHETPWDLIMEIQDPSDLKKLVKFVIDKKNELSHEETMRLLEIASGR